MKVSADSTATKVHFLSDSSEAFQARIDLILSAKQEIFAEYFSVWNDEQSVQLLTLMLKKAQSGVKVKLLFDALASQLPKSLVSALERAGSDSNGKKNFEIRFYNPFNILKPIQLQHREHAKMLIVDQKHLIIGGRNIGDKYFGWSQNRNYIDGDVFINGIISQQARQNFLTVWQSPLAKKPNLSEYSTPFLDEAFCAQGPGRDAARCKVQQDLALKDITQEMKRTQQALQDLVELALMQPYQRELATVDLANWFATAVQIDQVRFLSHQPEEFVSQNTNLMTKDIIQVLSRAEKDILISTPYVQLTPEIEQVFRNLLAKKKVRVRILTNSLMASDNLLAQAGYFSIKEKLIKMGFEIYEFRGPETAHAKMIVIDGKTTLVGTFNLNYRSALLDREVGVIFYEAESSHLLADAITTRIEELLKESVQISKDGQPVHENQWAENNPQMSLKDKWLLKVLKFLVPIFKQQL